MSDGAIPFCALVQASTTCEDKRYFLSWGNSDERQHGNAKRSSPT